MKAILAVLLGLTITSIAQDARSDQEWAAEVRKSVNLPEGYPTPPRRLKITAPQSPKIAGKALSVSNLSVEQYAEFFRIIVERFSQDSKTFGTDSSAIILEMMGVKGNLAASQALEISPLFNRSVLIAVVAVHNKLNLDDDDMKSFMNECVTYSKRTEDKNVRVMIAAIYATILAENEDNGKK